MSTADRHPDHDAVQRRDLELLRARYDCGAITTAVVYSVNQEDRERVRMARASGAGMSVASTAVVSSRVTTPQIIIADLEQNELDALFDLLTQRAILPNLVFEQREIP